MVAMLLGVDQGWVEVNNFGWCLLEVTGAGWRWLVSIKGDWGKMEWLVLLGGDSINTYID